MSLPIIDPNALMNALTPALKENGGLGGPTQACRVISILKDTKKLISKAVYLKVFQQDTPDATESFTHNGGWQLLHQWLVEANNQKLYYYMREMVNVYRLLPVTIELLKKNSTAKIIKQLSKNTDAPEDVRDAAGDLTSQWLKLITSSKPVDGSAWENQDVEKKIKKKTKEENGKRHNSGDKTKSKDLINSKTLSHRRDEKKSLSPSSSLSSNSSVLNSDDSTKLKDVKSSSSNHSAQNYESKKNRTSSSVKTYKTQFRKTGLETSEGPLKKKLKVDVKTKEAEKLDRKKVVVSPSGSSINSGKSLIDTIIGLSEKKSKVSSPTTTSTSPSGIQSKIKLIPPKPKPVVLQDSNAFMNSLDAATLHPGKRVKKKIVEKKAPSSTTPSSPTPTSTPTGDKEVKVESQANGEVEEKISDDADVKKEDTDETSEVNNEAEESKPDNGTPTGSILMVARRRKSLKAVKWAESDKLTSVQYFELDETERVNVNRIQFESMKQKEMMRERAVIKNKLHSHLTDEPSSSPQGKWRPLFELDTKYLTIFDGYGKHSKEKSNETNRQNTVLQALYLTKESIPYTPTEPDYEEPEKKSVPIEIPISTPSDEVETDSAPTPTATPTQPTFSDVLNFLHTIKTDTSTTQQPNTSGAPTLPLAVAPPLVYPAVPPVPYPADPNLMYPPGYTGYYGGYPPADGSLPHPQMTMPHLPPPPLMPQPPGSFQTHTGNNQRFKGPGIPQHSNSDKPRWQGPSYQNKGQLRRDIVCRHFLTNRGCRKEDNCNFLHPGVNGPAKENKTSPK